MVLWTQPLPEGGQIRGDRLVHEGRRSKGERTASRSDRHRHLVSDTSDRMIGLDLLVAGTRLYELLFLRKLLQETMLYGLDTLLFLSIHCLVHIGSLYD